MAFEDYSISPALNTDMNGIFTGEGMARDDVNGGLRQLMADGKSLTTQLIDPSNPFSVTAAATLTINEFNRFVVCSGTTVNYSVSLPPVTASNIGDGLHISIARTCTKLITIQAASGSGLNIDGKSNRVMHAGEDAFLIYNGSEWIKLFGHSIPFALELLSSGATTLTIDSWNHIPLTQGAQQTDETSAMCFDTNRFVAPRDGIYSVTGHLGIGNLSAAGQCDIGMTTGTGTPSGSPASGDFGRFSFIDTAPESQYLCFTRRIGAGNYMSPVVRPISPLTTAEISAGIVSRLLVLESPVW